MIKGIVTVLAYVCFAGTAHGASILSLDNVPIPYDTWHKTMLPGASVSIKTDSSNSVQIDGEPVTDNWNAPNNAGTHILTTTNKSGEILNKVALFVLEPSHNIDSKGYLGQYRIGKYPKNTPAGFIKVSKDDIEHNVSPNFKIGQFLCKQQPGQWPKYVLVSDRNITRLETLLAKLKAEKKTKADTLFVMSGFRTPYYNTAIKASKYSRHMYGDAADIYIDHLPRDGNMDDINSDGSIDKDDANYLYDFAQTLYTSSNITPGGLGSYKANAVHGPFVHIDARGRQARWGR